LSVKQTQKEMKSYLLILTFLIFMLACKNSVSKVEPVPQKEDTLQKTYYTSQFDSLDLIVPFMKNKIRIDSLMEALTNQSKVKLISQLKAEWDDSKKIYVYSDSSHYFELKTDT